MNLPLVLKKHSENEYSLLVILLMIARKNLKTLHQESSLRECSCLHLKFQFENPICGFNQTLPCLYNLVNHQLNAKKQLSLIHTSCRSESACIDYIGGIENTPAWFSLWQWKYQKVLNCFNELTGVPSQGEIERQMIIAYAPERYLQSNCLFVELDSRCNHSTTPYTLTRGAPCLASAARSD